MLSIITGGSRGIGYAIAEQLAAKGSNLLLVAKNLPNLEKAQTLLSDKYNVNISIHNCDLSDEYNVDSLANRCISTCMIPDLLVLDAGVFLEGSLTNSSPNDFRKTMDVNLNSIYYLVRHLVPHMKSLNKPKIVIIGSTAAFEPYIIGGLYGVSKWALRGYAINLRRELMNSGIGVTFVAPGATWTDLWAGEQLPENRLLVPKDIGILVASLIDLSPQAVVEEIIVRPMLGDMHE